MINGVLNVYKEKGYTSHDVVARLRGICRQKKIGHTGTLDPEAEGVLPVCLGNATKLCALLTDKRKEYVAELMLGIETDTQDMTGRVLQEKAVVISEREAEEAALSFLGKQRQIPPMYSACKVNGKKLYELARAGVEVERKAREIEIFELEIQKLSLPRMKIRVCCSKGTYIRTLCHDIGKKLGCGAAMTSLVRTRVDDFTAGEALRLAQIERLAEEGRLTEHVTAVDEIFGGLSALVVKEEWLKLIDNGNPFYAHMCTQPPEEPEGDVRVYSGDGRFYGIYAFEPEKERYRPVQMFLDR